MKKVVIFVLFLIFQMSLLSQVLANNSGNPYANIPQGVMPNGMNFQKLMQNQQTVAKKKKKKAERAAISRAIADEELAKAKAEVKPGSFDNPHAAARVRTEKRMAPIYKKWKEEDAAENAPLREKIIRSGQQLKQTGDFKQHGEQQREMLKQMGIELPANN